MIKKLTKEIVTEKRGSYISICFDPDGTPRVGFCMGNEGIFVDNVPGIEETLQRCVDYANLLLEQPEKYSDWCKHWDIEIANVDENVPIFNKTMTQRNKILEMYPDE